jgi:hypothetical protein
MDLSIDETLRLYPPGVTGVCLHFNQSLKVKNRQCHRECRHHPIEVLKFGDCQECQAMEEVNNESLRRD